jgi:hypothetical protein
VRSGSTKDCFNFGQLVTQDTSPVPKHGLTPNWAKEALNDMIRCTDRAGRAPPPHHPTTAARPRSFTACYPWIAPVRRASRRPGDLRAALPVRGASATTACRGDELARPAHRGAPVPGSVTTRSSPAVCRVSGTHRSAHARDGPPSGLASKARSGSSGSCGAHKVRTDGGGVAGTRRTRRHGPAR